MQRTYKLLEREFHTVQAVLRYWQRDLAHNQWPDDAGILDIADNGGEVAPLSADEIDTLCEDLNTGERSDAALHETLQAIADAWPDDRPAPAEEDYDDTESAYYNGLDVATCNLAALAKRVLLNTGGRDKPLGPVAVVVQGGIVQDVVTTDRRLVGSRFITVDYDVEGVAPDEITQVRQGDGSLAGASCFVGEINPAGIDLADLDQQLAGEKEVSSHLPGCPAIDGNGCRCPEIVDGDWPIDRTET